MPLPSFLVSASVLICERILSEADHVLSVIRIVDVFNVVSPPSGPDAPAPIPVIQPYALILLKAEIGYEQEHELEIRILNTVGEWSVLGGPIQVKFDSSEPTAPGGVSVGIQLNLGIKRFGTCYICAFLDGEELARASITLRRAQPSQVGE